MKNREVFVKDPDKNPLLNNGVASVSDEATPQELRTLRYELETFVCKGEYEKGLQRILSAFLSDLDRPEQRGVWVSGFFGCGKSHFLKVLRALWLDYVFQDDKATARGIARLPQDIKDSLRELATAGKRLGGLHAASGTIGAGAGDSITLALLAIIFRSVGLPEQYPLARFVMWLKREDYLEEVKSAVKAAGKDWSTELQNLYASPHIAGALLKAYPGLANNTQEVHAIIKTQYPLVKDITITELVDAINQALSKDGSSPLTLIALDEIQQYIGDNAERAFFIQEVTEACCKKFAGRLMFVGTGQTALSGTPLLQRLKDRFPISIELSDADVETVIRQVILAKKPDRNEAIRQVLMQNQGEISRHLQGTKLEYRPEDIDYLVPDYPILPVRRRFWEKALRAVDYAGTSGQLRSQLKIVYEAVRATADQPLGWVVPADFIFFQKAPDMLLTGVLSREIYENIIKLQAGNYDDVLKACLCGLIFHIGKLPRELGADLGVRATPDVLADLLVEDLQADNAELRKKIPPLLQELEAAGILMQVGDEYHLQTRVMGAWNDEFKLQLQKILANPSLLAEKIADLFKESCKNSLGKAELKHGKCKEPRKLQLHFGAEPPSGPDKNIYVWVRDGWSSDEKSVVAEAQQAGNQSPTIFAFIPKNFAQQLKDALGAMHAAQGTIDLKGVPTTPEGQEARSAMETRLKLNETTIGTLVKDIFSQARVLQGGGQEIAGTSLAEMVNEAAKNSLVRLYQEFDKADHEQWGRVMERAKKGDGVALNAVDYQGDPEKHPVCATLLNYVGAGKKGSDIRKTFEAPPYGWPRDAIDGGIYTLLVSGHMRAGDANQQPVDAQSLERTKLTQANFRRETVTVTVAQRLQVRSLLQQVGIVFKPGEELSSISTYLAEMGRRAEGAGGEPPLPVQPDTKHLDELGQLSGNAQLVALADKKDTLSQQADDWLKTGQDIQERQPRWEILLKLLEQAQGLEEAGDIQTQAASIRDQRQLLADPDPVPGLVSQVAQLLRDRLVQAQADHRQIYKAEMASLKQDDNWGKLTPDQREKILQKHDLTMVPDIATGNEKEVLDSLNQISLSTWRDRREALPQRFNLARLEAARLLQPKAVPLSLPKRTLSNETEARQWLSEVEELVLEKVSQGPVVV
jgi:hypothetical protein